MGFVIGMDEAGYGPNLGPLVLTATVWEVPGRWPKKTDFWKAFEPIAQPRSRSPNKKGSVWKEDGGRSPNGVERRRRSPTRRRAGCTSPTRRPSIARPPDWEHSNAGRLAAFGVASRVPSDFDELLDDLWAQSTDASR